VLRARGLSIGYEGRVVAEGIDLAVARGEVLCLLGPNGAGKTTLFKTLLGLLPPIAGAIGWVLLLSPGSGFLNVVIRNISGSDAKTGPLNIYSWYGLILIYVIYMIPFAFLMVSSGLRNPTRRWKNNQGSVAPLFSARFDGSRFRRSSRVSVVRLC